MLEGWTVLELAGLIVAVVVSIRLAPAALALAAGIVVGSLAAIAVGALTLLAKLKTEYVDWRHRRRYDQRQQKGSK